MAFPATAPQSVLHNDIDTSIARIIDLIGQLGAVIEEENRLLATGVPASLSGSIALKSGLAMQLEAASQEVYAQPGALEAATPHMRDALVQSSKALSQAMEENIVRIKAAIEATGARVNAIMGAIREHAETDTSYRANGTVGTTMRSPALTAGRLA